MSINCNYNPITRTRTFILDGNGSTYKAIEELQQLISFGRINPEKFTMATLRYNADIGLGMEETEDFYPLKFKNKNEEVWLSSVSAGYGGTGPHGTLEALELMGFLVTEEIREIVLKKTFTDEIFTK